ncbi:MAG: metal ABC transporter ATP-binding protein [Myxococcales bacterium]|nr:MAG: metal ABC transporter ATP-binding protein [Myxococcales bacterium]
MSQPVVELRDVCLSLNDVPVLENIDLTLERDDYVAILGPNGSGKTTLLKIILGLIEPDRGEVRVLGGPPTRAHGRVGYVPQRFEFDLTFPISVLELVLMGRLGARGLGRRFRAEDQQRALAMLERVSLTGLANRQIGTLSGGQLHRALIARALASAPELLLMDEPTASLDERVGRSLWELLEELSQEMTVVIVSHDVGAISRYVRSVACLNVRLHYHQSKELTPEVLEATYGCPVDLLAHGHPHRVLHTHGGEGGSKDD